MNQDYEMQYQNVYQLLINNRNLLSLSQFHQHCKKQIYPTTNQYPQFFNYNLVNPARVVKQVKSSNAALKSFYYQLMKLCFEIQINEKDYIEIFKSIVFDPLICIKDTSSSSPTSGNNYSDDQYKKLIAEFMEYLMAQSIPNFEQGLNTFPIMDQALQKTFESFLVGRGTRQQSNNQIFQYFSQIFEITLTTYDKCYKFQQSDVFVYEQNQNQLYMAYMNQMGEVSQNQESQSQNLQQQQQQQQYDTEENQYNQQYQYINNNINEPSSYKKQQQQYSQALSQNKNRENSQQMQHVTIKNKYSISNNIQKQDNTIMNMFGDIHSNSNSKQAKYQSQQQYATPTPIRDNIYTQGLLQNSTKQVNKCIHTFETVLQSNDNDLKYQDPNIARSLQIQPVKCQQNGQKSYQQKLLQSQIHPTKHQKRISFDPKQQTVFSTYESNKYSTPLDSYSKLNTQQQLIYRPKNMLNTVQQMNSSRQQTNPNGYQYNNNYFQKHKLDDSRGTFYKQFTNTKILQIVNQPHKTKIRMIKNRFVGIRSKNI